MKLLTVEDVMKRTGFSMNHCYILIRKLRKEMEKEGKLTFCARIDEDYFNERLGFPS